MLAACEKPHKCENCKDPHILLGQCGMQQALTVFLDRLASSLIGPSTYQARGTHTCLPLHAARPRDVCRSRFLLVTSESEDSSAVPGCLMRGLLAAGLTSCWASQAAWQPSRQLSWLSCCVPWGRSALWPQMPPATSCLVCSCRQRCSTYMVGASLFCCTRPASGPVATASLH